MSKITTDRQPPVIGADLGVGPEMRSRQSREASVSKLLKSKEAGSTMDTACCGTAPTSSAKGSAVSPNAR